MISFIPLASSSAGCSYLVTAPGAAPLLVDCGLSPSALRKRLWDHGVRLSDVCGVLCSHSHLDHRRGARDLINAGVDVWASRETLEAIDPKRDWRPYCILQPPTMTWIGEWAVWPVPIVHDCEGALGFIIRSPTADGGKLLYLTDTCYSTFVAPSVDILALEVNHDPAIMAANVASGAIDVERYARTRRNHMSIDAAESLLDAMDRSRLRKVVILHCSDANSNPAEFVERLQARFGVPVEVAAK